MGTVSDISEKKKRIKPRYRFDDFEDDGEEVNHGKPLRPWLVKELVSKIPDNFVYRGSSTRGESYPYTIRVELSLMGEIRKLVETKATPFKATQEFVKTAIYIFTGIWAKKLESIEKGRKILLNIEKRYITEQQKIRKNRRIEFSASINEFKEEISKLNLEKDKDQLDEEINDMLDEILSLNDKKWRQKYLENVRSILAPYQINIDDYFKKE